MIPKGPAVHVLIPCYNSQKTILQSLNSIRNQTYQHLFIHIVDNASTDQTLQLIKDLKDQRITIHNHSVNTGNYGNFDRCLQLSSGEYTAIFHSDDIYHPQIIEEQVSFLENNPQVGIVFTEVNKINMNGQKYGEIHFPKEVLRMGPAIHSVVELLKLFFRYDCFLVCPSAMARSTVYKDEIQKTNVSLFKTAADVDVWVRISENYQIGLIPKKLMSYRLSPAQHSFRIHHKRSSRSDIFYVFNYYRNKYLQSLVPTDLLNLKNLKRTDFVIRSWNCFWLGHIRRGYKLLKYVPGKGMFTYALSSKKGAKTLLAWVLLSSLGWLLGAAMKANGNTRLKTTT